MLSFRNATPDDLDALTALFVTCFNAPPWNDGWSFDAARERLGAMMSARHFRGVLALAEGNVVGLALGQKERWVDAFHFNLQEMCVLPSRQRSGIGRALMQHLSDELLREGVTKLYLITGPDSPAAAFYSALGFYTSSGRSFMARRLGGHQH